MTCKGLVAVEKGKVKMTQVEVPEPGPNEIQIKMASTLVSAGTERAWVLGLPNAVPEYPYVPGYCCAGTVVKCGSQVTNFSIGQRVACYAVDIGHREIGNVPDYRVVPVPENVNFDRAAFTSLGQTSLQGVRKCKIELGERVVSLGLGLVGMIALQFAALNGALPAIAIDRDENRLALAGKNGAHIMINNSKPHWEKELAEATSGLGPNVVIDNTGVPSAMADACRMAADYARVCILGCPRGLSDFNFYSLVQKKSITIIGAHAVDSIPRWQSYPHYWTFADDAACFLNFVQKGYFNLDSMISRIVSANEAENAYNELIQHNPSALGMIIRWPE